MSARSPMDATVVDIRVLSGVRDGTGQKVPALPCGEVA
jgi:hypothetical protein